MFIADPDAVSIARLYQQERGQWPMNAESEFEIQTDRTSTRTGNTSSGFEIRVRNRIAARRFVAQFLAVVIAALSVIFLVPAFYEWKDWSTRILSTQLPIWFYLTLLIAAINLIYAIVLWIIPDWSTLQITGWFLLACCCLDAAIASAIRFGGSNGVVASQLQIVHSQADRAAIWMLAMLCLQALVGYLCYREYYFWKKTEVLFIDLFGPDKRGIGEGHE
ncbi:MAG: hypothetical protein R3C03_21910 [Pirellulaceae bacterium]